MKLLNVFKREMKIDNVNDDSADHNEVMDISKFKLLEVDELDEGVWKHTLNQILDYEGDDWRNFERFIAWLLRKQGYDVTLTQPFADGGKDIIINVGDSKVYVEAKIRNTGGSFVIGKEYVDGLVGKMKGEAVKGVIVTNHYFTLPAKEAAAKQNVELIDREGLINLVSRICPDMVFKSFYERERERIGACPKCEGVLLKKQNRKTKEYFKGCSNYKSKGGCGYQEKIPQCEKQ